MQLNGTFCSITMIVPWDGASALFWKDVWIEHDHDAPLSEVFPRAFSFCTNEDESVGTVLMATDPAMLFHLPLSTQARQEVREIQQRSRHVVPERDSADSWVCTLGGKFSASKYYNHYFRETIADEAFLWLWKAKSPIKFKLFGWLLLVDRLNTRNMLKRRHYTVVDNIYTCMMCQNPPEEMVEHLFFSCPFSQRCWARVGLFWPNVGNRVSLLHAGRNQWSQPLFMDIFLLAAWIIWKERNNHHFRAIPPSFQSWLGRFKRDFELLHHRVKEAHRPCILDFVNSL